MASIVENRHICRDIHLMRLKGVAPGKAGQFYMLRQREVLDPFFGRPISLYDYDEKAKVATFLYRTVGRGTRIFSFMPIGERVEVQGPYGNGFPLESGNAILIGGGIGIAPLFLLLKTLRSAEPGRNIKVYLGYSEDAYMADEFCDYADQVICRIGGAIMDGVRFDADGTYYACGPEPMLMAAAKGALEAGKKLYISSEAHMACGVGVCLGCTCQTKSGNKRVCKDGPVFPAEEVLFT